MMNEHGNKYWKPVVEVAFVEELREIKPARAEVTEE